MGTRWNRVLLFAVEMGVLGQRILEESRKMLVVSSRAPVRCRRRTDVTPETPDINIFTFPAALRAALRDLPSNAIVRDKSVRKTSGLRWGKERVFFYQTCLHEIFRHLWKIVPSWKFFFWRNFLRGNFM